MDPDTLPVALDKSKQSRCMLMDSRFISYHYEIGHFHYLSQTAFGSPDIMVALGTNPGYHSSVGSYLPVIGCKHIKKAGDTNSWQYYYDRKEEDAITTQQPGADNIVCGYNINLVGNGNMVISHHKTIIANDKIILDCLAIDKKFVVKTYLKRTYQLNLPDDLVSVVAEYCEDLDITLDLSDVIDEMVNSSISKALYNR
jgi:hypothetical protein